MDLEALRAAVLNSRKNIPTAATPSADLSTPSTPSPINGLSPSATALTTPTTTITTTIATAAIIEATTNVKTQANGRTASLRPSTQGSDSSNTVESDKEEGEISDEEMNTNKPFSRLISVTNTPLTTHSQPSVASGPANAPQRPTSQEYRHQKQLSGGGSRDTSKTTTTENGKMNDVKSEQTSDFTSLLADYELSKARTDFRPQPVARIPDPAAISDIPGLGQLRNRERSLPPLEDSFRSRNRADSHYGSGPGYSREHQLSNSYSRDSYARSREPVHRGPDRPIHPPQRQLSSPATFPDGSNAFGPSEKPCIIPQSSTPEAAKTTQIHTLVDTLLGHGVLPEQLLQRKIDPVVINEVIQQRAARQGLAFPKVPATPFPPNLVTPSPIVPNSPQTQSYFPQQAWNAAPFAQPAAFTPPVPPATGISASDATEVANRLQLFLQTQSTPSQPQPPMPVSSTSDDIARKQLEMILSIASKVLPQGWNSLVQPRQDDNLTSAPSALGPTTTAPNPSSPPHNSKISNNSDAPLVIPVRRQTDGDQIRRDGSEAATALGTRLWTTEERDTTKKFGDLTISGSAPPPLPIRPVAPPAIRAHAAVANNSAPSINGRSHPSEKVVVPPPPPPPSLPLTPPPPPPPPSSPPKEECIPTGPASDQISPEAPQGAESTGTNRKLQSAQPADLSYVESIPAGHDAPTSGSQDEMDMDLDDGYGGSMILNGSWKTMEERTVNSSDFSPQHPPQHPPNRSTLLYNLQYGTPGHSHIHSAPASIVNTPVRSPSQTELQVGPTITRGNTRRATALDFIPKLSQPTPFIMERQLPYLIDLDDEDGDEIGGQPAAENFSALKPRMISTSNRSEFLNQEMKRLNERIAARERAKLSSPSTPITHNSNPQSPAQGAPSPMSQQLDPTSRKSSPQQEDQELTPGASSTPATDEADLLKETLSNHTKTLEQLRSQLQQFELEKRSAIESLGAEALKSENDRQDLQEVHQVLQAAKEDVALKAKELEEAQRHLRRAEGLLAPLLNRLDTSTAAKALLQERISRVESSCAELKASIANVQQDIIRKRTRMMMLGSNLTTKSAAKPSDTKDQSRYEKLEQQKPGEEIAQYAFADQEMAVAEDSGPKRGFESNVSTWDPTVPKKPRIQAKEELSALTKRMNELAKEKELLSTAALPPASTQVFSRPTAANMNDQSNVPASQGNVRRAPLKRTRAPVPTPTPSVQVKTSKPTYKPTLGSTAPNGLNTPNLSILDKFLSQPKKLQEEAPTEDHASNATPSVWSPSIEINKLFALDNSLFDMNRLCLPSDLASYLIPQLPKETQEESSVPQSSEAQDQPLDVTSAYESPLTMFRSFRFSPRYKSVVHGGYRSLTYSHKIDPMKRMCLYELSGGSCNDDNCKSQHIRDCGLTDEELVIDMARYSEGKSPETRKVFADMKSAKLAHLRASRIHNADILVDAIVKAHNELGNGQGSASVVKFGPRVTLQGEQAPPSAGEKPVMRTGPSIGIDNFPEIPEPSGSSLDEHPITMAILTKTLAGAPPSKIIRYHDKPGSIDYEALLKETSNVTIWAEFAMHELSSAVNNPDVFDEQLRKALSVLSRALGDLPTSESLWALYLDLHTRYGTELETRTMFEQCLQYVPQSHLLWFRYYVWEKDSDERVFVLDRMLQMACQEQAEVVDPAIQSRFIVDVVLQIVRNMVKDGIVEAAKNWMQNFLTCTTWESVRPSSLSYAQLDDVWLEQDMVEDISSTLASRILSSKDLCILWLAYVYLIWFHELPTALFHQYPNDYLSDDSFFVIQWPVTEELEQETELYSIVHEIFLGLTVYFVDLDARLPVVALLRNFVGFLMSHGQNQDEIMELVNPYQFSPRLPEVRDLFCEVQMHYGNYTQAKEALEATVQEMPFEPYFWNRYAYMLSVDKKADCLGRCARAFFDISEGEEFNQANAERDSSEQAILLYKKLLGLDLPYNFKAPPAKVEIAPFRTNTFLWLNYLSLLALQAKDVHSLNDMGLMLSAAFDSVPRHKRSLIVTELATHSIMLALDKALETGKLESIIESATSNIIASRPNPYDKNQGEDLGVSSLHDFRLLNKVVETIWKRIAKGPDELRVHLIGSLLRLFPEDFDLYFWLGEAQERAGHVEQCRKILVSCLRRFPTSEHLWKRMIEIFKDSESSESMDLIKQASVFSSLASKMDRMPALGLSGNGHTAMSLGGNEKGAVVIEIKDDHEEEMPIVK
ncbi:Zinc finger C3H1 domain-containing protein [Linnemannia schmuckeri]|uniref:Zinc finger C3H1 domain-containing protein n=1 Tax=Linnemannia schmuckeri TaxID=64567 RepID=A0A9P5VBF4_9FUNG|nr:Zinc finger C3H1 domain-containing protein [Linnemannia schmuckeri]